MMKSIFFALVAVAFAVLLLHQEPAFAEETPADEEYRWNKTDSKCLTELHRQINKEFDASIVYLKYAAYFAQYDVNLPGFEKFFFNAAGEEREHGIKLIEYALMRGHSPIDANTFKLDYSYQVPASTTGEDALRAALRKEEEVTKSIRKVIAACEDGSNDYHLADYLTGEYLDEQHKGQRELADKIETLRKMKRSSGYLGEFLFDKSNM